MREGSFQIDSDLFCACIFLGKMQSTGEWGISKMKSKLPHKEITPKLLRGKKYITWKEGHKNILSFFSETTISSKEHKIKVFFREGTAGMETVPAPL